MILEDLYRYAFIASSDAVILFTTDTGAIELANPSALTLYGYSEEELCKLTIEVLCAEVDPDPRSDSDSIIPLLQKHRRKDGTTFPVDVSVGNFGLHGAELAVMTVRDQTAARKAEVERLKNRLLMADRLTSIGRLAAGVGHEVNNPLTYVIGNIEIVLRTLVQWDQENPGREPGLAPIIDMLSEAREGAERVARIVRDLRILSRGGDEAIVPVDVARVIDSSINITWNEIRHRARLVKDFVPVPMVDASESQLGQVFINLLVNAAQSIPMGEVDENEIRIVIRPDDQDRVVVEVHDTGTGIEPADLVRVFDPFFSTKVVGVGIGLGLSISHSIVEKLGGEVEAESTVGAGSVFRVLLPRSRGAVATGASLL